MPKLNLNTAEKYRIQLTKEQQYDIKRLYSDVAKSIDSRIDQLKDIPSAPLQRAYLQNLKKQVKAELKTATADLQSMIEGNMESVSQSVVDATLDFTKQIGFSVQGLYSNVPNEVVKTVATGKLYQGDWSLSKALWKNTAKTQQDINTIVARGIAENRSALDIAKDLEKYVDPSAAKPWDWSKVYPGVSTKIDYNAQRLARTMVSHAYQQSFVRTTKNNPFVTEYIWVSAGSERTCEICDERDGKHFAKDDLPLDHPNGMCTFEAYIPDSMEDIADRLADWVKGKDDPELDKWAADLTGGQKEASYTDKEKEALTTYTRSAYSGINSYLRGDENFGSPDVKTLVSLIDSAMEKSTLESETIVFRGDGLRSLTAFNPSANRSWFELADNLQSLEGKTAELAAYTSTSTDGVQKQFSRGLEWTFIAEPGVHAIDMKDFSVQQGESEILFDRGTKVEILHVDVNADEDGYIKGVIRVLARLKP